LPGPLGRTKYLPCVLAKKKEKAGARKKKKEPSTQLDGREKGGKGKRSDLLKKGSGTQKKKKKTFGAKRGKRTNKT